MTSMKVRSKPRVAAPGDEVVQLVLVDALERDGVDLDPEPGLDRGVDAVHHLGEAAPAGDLRELRGVERVERDVDPPDAAVGELGREAAELAAVGGQRQLLERAGLEVARHGAEEGHDALAHQRLAAGDPELLDAEADEGRAEPVELLERQQLGLGQELHVLGHAVDAAEVAAVGHRDAQVGDRARERVDQAWHARSSRTFSPRSDSRAGRAAFQGGIRIAREPIPPDLIADGMRLHRSHEERGIDGAEDAPEPAKARHCLAPVRRTERASAEAEGGAAGTVGG